MIKCVSLVRPLVDLLAVEIKTLLLRGLIPLLIIHWGLILGNPMILLTELRFVVEVELICYLRLLRLLGLF